MACSEGESGVRRGSPEITAAANPERAAIWVLASFGLLVAGLAGGALALAWRPLWAWPFPAAGFLGYLLAFRRGMLLLDPGIDSSWRHHAWIEHGPGPGHVRTSHGGGVRENPNRSRLFHPAPPYGPRREPRAIR